MNCARRELIEETGFSADQWHSLGKITPVPGYSDERIHIFLATDLHSAERDLDEDEIIQVHRVACEDALAMLRRGDIQDAKSIAGLFLALEWLKFRTLDGS
jgi:ADP-ribose pyrophosphatase